MLDEPVKTPHHLNALLDHLLQPERSIDDTETIEWCRWLVPGTPAGVVQVHKNHKFSRGGAAADPAPERSAPPIVLFLERFLVFVTSFCAVLGGPAPEECL